MKTLILLAGASLLAASPAHAKPDHSKHAKNKNQASFAQAAQVHGQGICPPGLAKKSPACVPPGQARKQFKVGERLPNGYNGYTPYSQIPYDLRRRHRLNTRDRYIYRDDHLYRVDPKTLVVRQVLSAILR
ncbi:MAG TPA: hypothetical protein VGB39_04905 [Sphingomicrobium sp.]